MSNSQRSAGSGGFLARLGSFHRSQSGATAPIMGLVMLMLIGCMGLALDSARSVLVKARLVSALDAAGLAVGARTSTTDYNAEALKFVSANFPTSYAGATVKTVTATLNSDKTVISLAATADVPTIFMKLFGKTNVAVTASTEVTRSVLGMELVLALDNTGSMLAYMPALKEAANNLVNSVFGANTTSPNLFVGLAPFSSTVNIGTSRSGWVNFVNNTKKNWRGCVMARGDGMDQTDDVPQNNATRFSDYYYPYSGGSLYCPSEITPLTNVKKTVTDAISDMTAAGQTHINLGAVWGWRLLSPDWRKYWDTPSWEGTSLPLDYKTPKMNKVLVLMTDGDNTMNSSFYTAYQWLYQGVLGTTNGTKAEAELDKRLTNVCTSVKGKGVIIYTVAFNNPGTATKTLLQNCATSAAYYFDASSSSELKSAFQTIGDSLSNLRVSK